MSLFKFVEPASMDQYKSLFFNVFADAYRSGYCLPRYRISEEQDRAVMCKDQRPVISGDSIREYALSNGWIRKNRDVKRNRDVELLGLWWDAWVYAWRDSRATITRKYTRRRTSPHGVIGLQALTGRAGRAGQGLDLEAVHGLCPARQHILRVPDRRRAGHT